MNSFVYKRSVLNTAILIWLILGQYTIDITHPLHTRRLSRGVTHDPDKILLPIEIHMVLFELQATHKPALLLPPSSLVTEPLLNGVWNIVTTLADVIRCSNCIENHQE